MKESTMPQLKVVCQKCTSPIKYVKRSFMKVFMLILEEQLNDKNVSVIALVIMEYYCERKI